MDRLRTLLIGDFAGAEFAPVVETLTESCRIQFATNLADAIMQLAAGDLSVDAIVLAWPYPGAFSAWEIHRLRRAAPLARQLAVLGSWCEGEGRSGEIIPGLIRTVWHQWTASWAAEFQARNMKQLPSWCLPETTGDEERLLARSTRHRPPSSGLIAIASRQFETAELYSAVCGKQGYSTVWLSGGEDLVRIGRPTAIVWDGDANRLSELSEMHHQSSAPMVALIDFPRADDVRRATEAGAVAVLGRPMPWDCLFWHLDRLDRTQTARQRVA
ncbi:MAG: hypothetical protein K8T91_13065 [Planctomycetes bacterium]|nr:hypothetical protein [Planctomycetota bacterium]